MTVFCAPLCVKWRSACTSGSTCAYARQTANLALETMPEWQGGEADEVGLAIVGRRLRMARLANVG